MIKRKIKQIQNLKNRPQYNQYNQNNPQNRELQENNTNSTWFQGNKITMKKMAKEFRIGAKAQIELIPQSIK